MTENDKVMKANAPEKIYVYIPDDDIVGTASTQKSFPHQFVTEEYTRTDAFIEKARRYFYKELPNFRSFMESGTAFIKNFESFIQGE